MLGAMLLCEGSGTDGAARALEVLWLRMGCLQYQVLVTGLLLCEPGTGLALCHQKRSVGCNALQCEMLLREYRCQVLCPST